MLREPLARLGAETSTSNAAETAAYIASERSKWGKLITDIKLKLE
jgi:tripartite-type tricarboxylate transporter receptor subunit TctC